MNFSYFNKTKEMKPSAAVSLVKFINNVKQGTYKPFLDGIPKKSDKKAYDQYKREKLPCVCISGTFSYRNDDSLEKHSGLICMDFDNIKDLSPIKEKLRDNEYVSAFFMTPSKQGLAVIVKITPCDTEKHSNFYIRLEEYFLEEFGLYADPACKNVSRLRYVSSDKDAYYNEDAKTWTKSRVLKEKKKPEAKNSIFVKKDIDYIFEQINDKKIDLTDDSYSERLILMFAICQEFGEAGRDYAHTLCKFSSKYDPKECDDQYDKCLKNEVKNSSLKSATIGSLIYKAKKSGVVTMTKSTSIAAVYAKISKQQQRDVEEGIKALFMSSNAEEAGVKREDAKKIFDQVYKSDNVKITEITIEEQIEEYLKTSYDLKFNTILNKVEFEGKPITDRDLNKIWFETRKTFKDENQIPFGTVFSIAENIVPDEYDPFIDFIHKNRNKGVKGTIDKVASTIETTLGFDENEFNGELFERLFKKWYCGIAASMLGDSSPLMLVLTGKQGTGKTEFFRRLLPDDLKSYYAESKLDRGKDDEMLLCNNLLVLDDEFSGKSKRESEKMKDILSKKFFQIRPPYGKHVQTFRRIAVLAGTGNDPQVLFDPTGNRRVIPADVISIDHELFNSIDKVSMIIEAVDLIEDGFNFMLTHDEVKELNDATTGFEEISVEADMIESNFRPAKANDIISPGSKLFKVSTGQIISMIEKKDRVKMNKRRLIQELRKLGFEEKSTRIEGIGIRKRWYLIPIKDVVELNSHYQNSIQNLFNN